MQVKAARPAIAGLKTFWQACAMTAASQTAAACVPLSRYKQPLFADLFCQVVLNANLLNQFQL